MNGEISVQSPPQGTTVGSEFTVSIPIGAANGAASGLESYTSSAAVSSNHPTIEPAKIVEPLSPRTNTIVVAGDEDKKVILLVEDNADIVAYLATCLQDYQLVVAQNGAEGLEMSIDITPDMIITDVMMPVMDGFEMCKRIKSDVHTQHIPIIMLTAKADLSSKIEGLEQGANVYLSKPFSKEELLLQIQNLFTLRKQLQEFYLIKNKSVGNENVQKNIPSLSSAADDAFVLNVRSYIEKNIENIDLNVEKMAQDFHFSHSQFSRKLDAMTGLAPIKYIRYVKLQKASAMLITSDESITAISYTCGFNDPGYFSRVFKKEFGLTPADWRSKNMEAGPNA
jgi:YesN/AraC family two-component response regulator